MRLGAACLSLGFFALAACTTPNPGLANDSDGASSGEGSTAGPATTTAPTTGSMTGMPTSTTTPTTGPTTTAVTTAGDSGSSTGEDPSETDTADTEPPASCGEGSVCIADAPAEWTGPVAWADTDLGDDEPACPTGYPEQLATAFDDLVAPAATCECSCGTASGASCGTVTLEYHGTDSSCGTADNTFNVTGVCSGQPGGPNDRYWQVPEPGVAGGSCTPTGSEESEPAVWSSRSTVCGGATGSHDGCDAGESCLDTPADAFAGRVCVWRQGEHDCPPGAFSDRFVRHSGIDDNRGCADCTCGAPTGTCNGSVFLWTDNTCTSNPDDSVSLGGSCSLVSNGAPSSGRTGTTTVADVECEPSVGTAIGEANPADPITLCCQDV